ncbi:MAG TPA: hypothetical protein VEX14_02610 [Burkholderiaceae bacterium]|nr:hypothetical protein [Burkholderiaceae bacterium]
MKNIVVAIALAAAAATADANLIRPASGAKLIKPDPRAVTNNGKSAQWLPINGTVRETIHIDNPTQYDMLFQYTNLKNGRTRPVRYGAVGCGQEAGVIAEVDDDGAQLHGGEAWALSGQQVFDHLAIQICARALRVLVEDELRLNGTAR